MGKIDVWLAKNGGALLLVGGAALVAAALLFAPPTAVAVAMVAMGAAMAVVGVLLPNLEGALKIGPGGLEAVLRDVARRAIQEGLDEDDRALALGDAYQQASVAAGTGGPIGSPDEQSAFADRIIRQFTDMHAVRAEDVPDEAVN